MTIDRTIEGYYGEAPGGLGHFTPRLEEFMHYLYLPVRVPEHDLITLPRGVSTSSGNWARFPDRLWMLHEMVTVAMSDARHRYPHLEDPYVYLTVRRGFATPGNPLNRPGWHCDDFGGSDLNYIWSDRYGTRMVLSDDPLEVSEDDARSMIDMTAHAALAERNEAYAAAGMTDLRGPRMAYTIDQGLFRLSPYVVHDTPIIPAPGGMRSFVKVSISTHRYDLVGNSHNYLLDYDWKMHSREELRNLTTDRNRDYSGVKQGGVA